MFSFRFYHFANDIRRCCSYSDVRRFAMKWTDQIVEIHVIIWNLLSYVTTYVRVNVIPSRCRTFVTVLSTAVKLSPCKRGSSHNETFGYHRRRTNVVFGSRVVYGKQKIENTGENRTSTDRTSSRVRRVSWRAAVKTETDKLRVRSDRFCSCAFSFLT